MSQAFIVCPVTGKSVYTGLNLEWLEVDAIELGEQTLKCPECGQTHFFTKFDLQLRSDGTG